jgi:hypothetical protein
LPCLGDQLPFAFKRFMNIVLMVRAQSLRRFFGLVRDGMARRGQVLADAGCRMTGAQQRCGGGQCEPSNSNGEIFAHFSCPLMGT